MVGTRYAFVKGLKLARRKVSGTAYLITSYIICLQLIVEVSIDVDWETFPE